MGFQAIGFDDFAKELDRLGKLDEYAPDMLETAAPILERELKGQVRQRQTEGMQREILPDQSNQGNRKRMNEAIM